MKSYVSYVQFYVRYEQFYVRYEQFYVRYEQFYVRYGIRKRNVKFMPKVCIIFLNSLLREARYFRDFTTSPCSRGRVAQSVGHLTRKSGVLGSIPGLATYFRFSFRFFKKGSCQLLAKVCARSTG